ncbi:dihydrolipoamide acetyltransferase family protein [Alteribacillus bidgolensis]|uniref:Dihydrolipoamide acetyltransferase component of pyruvate dehydrogenase complex n=1 Tax=Alteribacillus bidgolensis TaxID=930129 RepID=A0A1G8IG04_9BACI|nr:dihydrolipoamide acetyltransferase family protein [Alteribacillus bidgolensis]SDI17836.1 pyruvate dehydrogenase E2 component (dihydrolipoamide acetyltransferase) [Alteribacillus bidgolensis]
MAEQIVMPKFGMSMEEGTVVEWLKRKDEPVKKGEPIVTISSDKITNEVEAPVEGYLIKVTAKEDEVVKVGKPVGYIGEKGEAVESTTLEKDVSDKGSNSSSQSSSSTAVKAPPSVPAVKKTIKISPAAKKLAKAKGIPIENVTGTGPNGRITKQDIEKQAEHTSGENEKEEMIKNDLSVKEEMNTQPVKGMRKVIAERMHSSLQQSAQLTIMKKADITELLHLQKQVREELKESGVESKLTLTAFVAKAVTEALKNHPFINSSFENETITLYSSIHLGIATSLDDGLVVPVLKNADEKSVGDLNQCIQLLSSKARQGELTADEMKGSTFTITNLGAAGVEFFTPILNPPEAGILGVGMAQEAAKFENGTAVPRQYLPLSLTFDHRVVDGEPASRFLNNIASLLEKPYQLLL